MSLNDGGEWFKKMYFEWFQPILYTRENTWRNIKAGKGMIRFLCPLGKNVHRQIACHLVLFNYSHMQMKSYST